MDIVRGQFDEIACSATGSRTRPGGRVASGHSLDRRRQSVHCSGEMMVLTPEPNLSQDRSQSLEGCFNPADSSTNYCFDDMDSDSEKFSEQNGIKTLGTNAMDPGKQYECLSSPREQMKSNTWEVQISDKSDSEDNSEDCFIVQDQTKPLKNESDKQEDMADNDEDPQLEHAIAKMKTLDKILVLTEEKERQVKKQGEDLKKKLWEEFENAKPEGMVECPEVAENTMRFLALTPSGNGAEQVSSIFHTQLPMEDYERKSNEQDHDYQSCAEEVKLPSAACTKNVENKEIRSQMLPQNKIKVKDFIKKNIELAKEAKNPVLLTDDEKRRLTELLKNIDVEISNNEDTSMPWALTVAEREGYTPESMEQQQQLAEIDAKLQDYLLTEDDGSMITNSRSSVQIWSYQSSLDTLAEIGPGEEVLLQLRDEREQYLRMGEIEQQLKCLEMVSREVDIDAVPNLPNATSTSLLDDCIRCQSSGGLCESDVLDAGTNTSVSLCSRHSQATTVFNPTRLSDSVLSQLLEDAYRSGISPASGRTEGGSKELVVGVESEDPNYYRSKVLANISRLSERLLDFPTADDDKSDGEDGEWMQCDREVSYLTRALEIKQGNKPIFLVDSNLYGSMDREQSAEDSIPTIPWISHGGDENGAGNEDLNIADNEVKSK
ncbi:fibrous sheath-interacting protein 1 isoform X1 [Leucoraja erinacea]|uniref:fibrous sheath-interacting protein 1 isoform X1 n=1 Tax=Leucoraja erinaceus TaxID=7782 RepID=UPI0024572A43|nr:fibrous sheath-interacting protein 1 isoform X1 [Leucoraja erinacea]XP_055496715.1 fibrous sheath-interacting protein 1 isoform X1 [Leucoraja erinacea]XP_055496716.1 fibrous sheath-interacting protein 1 isoform X1 [Leucoraja erinacea]XP_055496717.1 fibrous sheath-interacting protein 1 isoform X1 [Leucoraja erinacea]